MAADALDGEGAALLKRADEALPDDLRERVYVRAGLRIARPRARAWPMVAAAALFALAVGGALYSARSGRGGGRFIDGTGVVRAGGVRLDSDTPLDLPAEVEVGRAGSAEVALDRGVDIRVEGPAVVRLEANRADVVSGAAFHRVTPGRGRFVVGLGDYEVVVKGTQFWTGRAGGDASVCLLEGSVEVRVAGAIVALLAPGDAWRSSDRAPALPRDLACRVPAPRVAAPAPREAPVPAALAATPTRAERATPARSPCDSDSGSEACLREVADGAGLAAQNALFRLAEKRAGRGDRRGALEAWLEYDRRFPDGSLAQETALSILQVRFALGAPQTREDAERFLARWPSAGHAGEVHAIHGAILARGGDCAGALVDFDQALAKRISSGRREEAQIGRATCLATVGREGDAARAFAAYLAERPDGRFAAQAREALRAGGGTGD